MKKRIFSAGLCLLLVCLCSCAVKQKVYAVNPLAELALQNQTEKIAKYDSPYTACFQEKDGSYNFYIFASPVQYQTEHGYSVIDNTLEETDGAYAYRNKANQVLISFPQELTGSFVLQRNEEKITFTVENAAGFKPASRCNYKNLYGDIVDAVCYEGIDATLYFYATNAGLRIGVLQEAGAAVSNMQLRTNFEDGAIPTEKETYITFHKNDITEGLFYPGQSKMAGENQLNANHVILSETDGGNSIVTWQIAAQAGKTGETVQAESALEFYFNKMPDSTAYSNLSHYPYLADAYELGNLEKGETNHFIRLRLNYFISTMPNNVIDASYYIRALTPLETADREQIVLNKVTSQWSSTRLTWEFKGEAGDEIASMGLDKAGNTFFDITEYAKECLADPNWLQESYGMVLSEKKNGLVPQTWMATSDSALYPPYIKLHLQKLPAYFEQTDNINNVDF